jgi:hypothetical protein
MVTFTPTDDLTGGSYTVAISGRQDAGGDTQQVAFNSGFTVANAIPAPVAIAWVSVPPPHRLRCRENRAAKAGEGNLDGCNRAIALR